MMMLVFAGCCEFVCVPNSERGMESYKSAHSFCRHYFFFLSVTCQAPLLLLSLFLVTFL